MDAVQTQLRKNTKLLIFIFLFVIMAISMVALSLKKYDSTSKSARLMIKGRPAPDFTFPDLNGNQVSLSDYRGKVVLVNIWATWCPPCVWEMPSMQKLYNKFKGESFQILAISIDVTGRKAVAPFMQKHKLTFPALLDPKETIRGLYGITGVPESFIIDKDGILVEKIIGPLDWATPEVFRFFQSMIQKPRS